MYANLHTRERTSVCAVQPICNENESASKQLKPSNPGSRLVYAPYVKAQAFECNMQAVARLVQTVDWFIIDWMLHVC